MNFALKLSFDILRFSLVEISTMQLFGENKKNIELSFQAEVEW